MSAYRRDFDETKYISFFMKYDELLEKNVMKFGKKLKIASKKNLKLNLFTMKKYLKAKRKPYNGKINTNFHNNEIPKEGSQFISLSVILINFIFRSGKNYYPPSVLRRMEICC